MTKKTPRDELQASIQKSIAAATVSKPSVDVELLRKHNPPLAEVLDVFIMSKTTRDDPDMTAKDLMRVLDARDADSELAQALSKLEDALAKGK